MESTVREFDWIYTVFVHLVSESKLLMEPIFELQKLRLSVLKIARIPFFWQTQQKSLNHYTEACRDSLSESSELLELLELMTLSPPTLGMPMGVCISLLRGQAHSNL
jgi:hypothetical protein